MAPRSAASRLRYLDSDILVLKDLRELRNTIARQSSGWDKKLNNAVIGFDHHHPFLVHALDDVSRNYNPNNWVSAGPLPATKAADAYPRKNCAEADCINVRNNSLFFPFGWGPEDQRNMMDAGTSEERYKELTNGAYAIHFYNHATRSHAMGTNSVLHRALVANCKLCLYQPED